MRRSSSGPGDQGEATALPIALLVSPAAGRLRVLPPRAFRDGRQWVERGQAVARIEHAGTTDDILAPMRGTIGGVLGRDGQPVTPGQAVAWIEADGEPGS